MISIGSMAETIDLGFVNKRDGVSTGLQTTGKTSSSAAIRLTGDMLGRYAGNQVRSVRLSLPKTNVLVDSIVVWVRSTLNGDNLASGKTTRLNDGLPTFGEGWNTVELSTPCDIPAEGDIYVGYTYYQRTKVCATKAVEKGTKGYSYVKIGSAGWQEYTAGALCIEAGIDGATMPKNDIELQSAKGIVDGDGKLTIEARLFNRGQLTARTLTFDIEKRGSVKRTDVDVDVAPNTLDTIAFAIGDLPFALDAGDMTHVTLEAINGNDDEFDDDNYADCRFNYRRYLFVEEFTTEQCPNCPTMAKRLADYIDGSYEYSRQLLTVCHHAGYYTDKFTTQSDLDYEWFYNNNGSTFAPAVMFNRRPYREVEGGMTPTVFPQSVDQVGAYADDCLSGESSLVLTSEAVADDGGKSVTMTVTGRKIDGFIVENPHIFVYLTEDNVLADGQAGSGTDTYYHEHIVRAQNATWGDPIEWDDSTFTYSCTFSLNPEWKTADMKLIAAVGNYDSTNPANCEIENSTFVSLGTTTGITTVGGNENGAAPTAAKYFTVGGTPVSDISVPGVYIVKDGKGTRKIVVK